MQARAAQVGKGFSEFLCRLVSRSEGPRIVFRVMYCIEHFSSIADVKYLPTAVLHISLAFIYEYAEETEGPCQQIHIFWWQNCNEQPKPVF
jgi:hypothetical protein